MTMKIVMPVKVVMPNTTMIIISIVRMKDVRITHDIR